MSTLPRLFFLLFLVFSLTGCDLWDDMVDSISGSGDDKDIEKVAEKIPEKVPEKVPEQDDDDKNEKVIRYETRFHHTQTNGPDGGKSLVLCPGQFMKFTSCSSGGVTIPFHGFDHGRENYWNMRQEPRGDIVCKKNGRTYRFRADRTFVYGQCK